MTGIDLALAQRVVDLLNECYALDPQAIESLFQKVVTCNMELGSHPTVQCGVVHNVDGPQAYLRLIGLINGIVGAYPDGPKQGWGAIAEKYDDDKKFVGFVLLLNEAS